MSIQENIRSVQARIAAALERAGRDAAEVTLVTVSKMVALDRIQEALTAGMTHFGENKVQEADAKIVALQARRELTWHLIGHLQTNKVKRAVELFDLIHSVDSLRLAQEISKRALQQHKVMNVLFEVNVSGETSKYGLLAAELLPVVSEAAKLEGLAVQGLMTMAPYAADPAEARPCFRKLREAFLMLRDQGVGQMTYLSMGMTNDFEVAIEEGANLVRIGTAIFGER